MDRPNLSATIRREPGETFVDALSEAGPDLLERDFDGIEQRLQDLSRRVLGRTVEVVVAVRAARPLTHWPRRCGWRCRARGCPLGPGASPKGLAQ